MVNVPPPSVGEGLVVVQALVIHMYLDPVVHREKVVQDAAAALADCFLQCSAQSHHNKSKVPDQVWQSHQSNSQGEAGCVSETSSESSIGNKK